MYVDRSFVPPARDEESETQRKAHAKRVRETRRSTQGVTLEELKYVCISNALSYLCLLPNLPNLLFRSAEQYVKNSQQQQQPIANPPSVAEVSRTTIFRYY